MVGVVGSSPIEPTNEFDPERGCRKATALYFWSVSIFTKAHVMELLWW